MWFIFACLSAVFAGMTAILSKIGVCDTDSTVATALRTSVVVVFSWIMVYVANVQTGIYEIDAYTFLFLILSGMATGASWLCYFKALQMGDVNKVTPIDKSSTILTMILAFLILGENITWIKVTAMVAIGVGTYLMIEKKVSITSQAGEKRGWLMYAIASAIFASLTSILGKIGIAGVNSTLGTAIRTLVVLVMAWIMVLVTGKQGLVKKVSHKSIVFIILSGIATGGSWLCYYKALKMGDASIVVPIDKLSIVLTIAFSRIFLKERLSEKSFIGLLLIVGGTMLLLL